MQTKDQAMNTPKKVLCFFLALLVAACFSLSPVFAEDSSGDGPSGPGDCAHCNDSNPPTGPPPPPPPLVYEQVQERVVTLTGLTSFDTPSWPTTGLATCANPNVPGNVLVSGGTPAPPPPPVSTSDPP